jgi:hypothetical protein
MYNWCQAQRQAQAGTHSGGKRKPLQQWQVDKLESIGFHWAKSDVNDEQWEQNFSEFKKHVDSNGNLSLPSMINGEHNLLYRWFFNQRIAFKENKVSKERTDKQADEKEHRSDNITYTQAGVSCFVGQESGKFKVQFFVGSSVVKIPACV